MTWNNEDIDYMFVDSHIGPRVVQCAGRLRKADFTLVIVVGTYQYEDTLAEDLGLCVSEKGTPVDGGGYGTYVDPLTGENRYNQIKEDSLRYQLAQIREWNSVSKLDLNCYHKLVRKWFGEDITIDKYDSREHKSRNVLNAAKVKLGEYYGEDKIRNLTASLKEIWGGNHRINIYVRYFMPEYEFAKLKNGNNKGKYIFRKK